VTFASAATFGVLAFFGAFFFSIAFLDMGILLGRSIAPRGHKAFSAPEGKAKSSSVGVGRSGSAASRDRTNAVFAAGVRNGRRGVTPCWTVAPVKKGAGRDSAATAAVAGIAGVIPESEALQPWRAILGNTTGPRSVREDGQAVGINSRHSRAREAWHESEVAVVAVGALRVVRASAGIDAGPGISTSVNEATVTPTVPATIVTAVGWTDGRQATGSQSGQQKDSSAT
jgi:hypothetical protein